MRGRGIITLLCTITSGAIAASACSIHNGGNVNGEKIEEINDTTVSVEKLVQLVTERYARGPLAMKGEYFRNWSHIEDPYSIHIQVRSIMDEDLIAAVFYERTGGGKQLVAGMVYVYDEVIELTPDGKYERYPSPSPSGPINSSYKYSCTTATAWQTWVIGSTPIERYCPSNWILEFVSNSLQIEVFENGWTVHTSTNSRKEEIVILTDGSIEVWRSQSLPGAEGVHSSQEDQHQWFDSSVHPDEIKEELALWAESPDLQKLESLVLKHVSLAEEHANKGESEHTQDLTGNLEVTNSETVKEEANISNE